MVVGHDLIIFEGFMQNSSLRRRKINWVNMTCRRATGKNQKTIGTERSSVSQQERRQEG